MGHEENLHLKNDLISIFKNLQELRYGAAQLMERNSQLKEKLEET